MEHIGESLEDYLECILILSRQLPVVRSVDVASFLGYSKPSVSHAVKLMVQQELVDVAPSKTLTLTPKGMTIALETYSRHTLLTDLFVALGVDAKTASADACRIEHCLSQDTFNAIRNYYHSHITGKTSM